MRHYIFACVIIVTRQSVRDTAMPPMTMDARSHITHTRMSYTNWRSGTVRRA